MREGRAAYRLQCSRRSSIWDAKQALLLAIVVLLGLPRSYISMVDGPAYSYAPHGGSVMSGSWGIGVAN